MLMRHYRKVAAVLLAVCVSGAGMAWTEQTRAERAAPAQSLFQVELDGASKQPVSGRLLLFASEAKAAQSAAKDGKVEAVDANPLFPEQTSVAAREVTHLAPGQTVALDADQLAFPAAFSKLPPGDYLVQAVLDVDHSYNVVGGRGAGDLVSSVVPVHLPATSAPVLKLTRALPASDPWTLAPNTPAVVRQLLPQAHAHTQPIDFTSTALSTFWGRPITMRGRVLLPPGYDAAAATRYPTVYYTQGFGGNNDRVIGVLANVYAAMAKGQMPPMIWVFLDESSPTGTVEFADSVNNGPWGQALTTELIPALEAKYHMDAKPNGRFLNGHSSGGWATLWLQTRYPAIFGGTWSTSPDSSDFHDFSGTDLYASNANVYRDAQGNPRPLIRDHGKVLVSFETFARQERVFGEYGGQLASFEWVFSPRGQDGRPLPMFDRDTGAVDPKVVSYWRDHYDIAYRLQQQWPQLKGDLDGKIHLYVGTVDTFYLDGAAHKLKAALDGLGAKSDIRFFPDKTHFDLYFQGDDHYALLKDISWQMYAIARPGSKTPSPLVLH
jgi:S-formylglutathione hydrolase FrmB